MSPLRSVLTAFALVAGASSAFGQTAAPVDSGRLTAARQLIEVLSPAATRSVQQASMVTTMMGNMVPGIIKGQPGMEVALRDHPHLASIFGRFVEHVRQLVLEDLTQHTPELIEAQAVGYARHYSTDELHTLAAFFSQPVGQKFLRVAPDLLRDPEVAAWQQEMAARNQQRTASEVEKFKAEVTAALRAEEARSSHGS